MSPARRSVLTASAGWPRDPRRLAGQVGYPARMAREIRALQVDQIGHRLQDIVQAGAGDATRERGLGVQDRVPVGGLIEAVQQVGCVLAEQVHHRRVELPPAMPARDRHGGRRVLSPAEDLDRAGQLHQPGGQADLVTP